MLRVIKKLIYNPRGRIIYFRQKLDNPIAIPSTKGNFQWRMAVAKDFDKLIAFYRPSSPGEMPSRRYDNGDFCLIALDGERIVAMLWCATKKHFINPVKKFIQIENGVGCIYHVLTDPEYRGRGLFGAGTCRMAQILKEQNFREVFLYISHTNLSSLRGIRKTAYEPYLDEEALRIFGLLLYRRKNVNKVHAGRVGDDLYAAAKKAR